MKRMICTMLLLVVTLCIVGCTKKEYGYVFHFYVEEGKGKVNIKTTSSFNPNVQKCKDVEDMCDSGCSDDTYFVQLLGGENGSRELTFIATPEEGYQVKEWKYNGQIVEHNKSNTFTAIVSSEDNYNGIISVSFEINREKTYTLNEVLGFDLEQISKIEYVDVNTIFKYNVKIKEFFESTNVDFELIDPNYDT